MKNNGAVKGIISTVAGEYTVPQGYHNGSGKVSIDATEQAIPYVETDNSAGGKTVTIG